MRVDSTLRGAIILRNRYFASGTDQYWFRFQADTTLGWIIQSKCVSA